MPQYKYHDLREGSHFHYVLKLLVHVTKCELAVFDLFNQFLVVVQLQFIHLVNEPFDITESEQLTDEWFRFVRLQVVYVLACADENDGTFGGCNPANNQINGLEIVYNMKLRM